MLLDAARELAGAFKKAGVIDELIGLTRAFAREEGIAPQDYWEKSNDINVLLYKKAGAKYIAHFENGCPNDAKAGGLMFMFEVPLG